jgi:Ca-activated chloride channel family protein
MNIYYPGHLWLLLILVPLVLALVFARKRLLKRFSRFAEPSFREQYLSRLSPFFLTLKYVLAILALVFIIFALARPQWDYEERNFDSSGLDIMICLDVSKSMDAQDMTPSRLLRAKLQVSSFLAKLKGDRVGVISFAGVPVLECPLTDDYASAELVLNSLSTDTVVQRGTDIGAALELAGKSFLAAGGSNILLLVTDGEDLQADALAQARRLSSMGVRIYTLGVGTEAGSTIKDPDTGREAFSKLDARSLKEIAAIGNGEYYNITPGQNELDLILGSIYSAEKGRGRSRNLTALRDQYRIPASIAVLILLAEGLFLPLRRKRERV